MRLYRPPVSHIRNIQQKQQSYYFSGAFDIILRKWGLVLGPDDTGFVCRETDWSGTFRQKPLIFEGPLSASTLRQFGLGARTGRTEQLELRMPSGDLLATLVLNRASVRRIPAQKKEVSEPYPFVSADPYWNSTAFDYQAFDPGPDSEPVLMARTENGRDEVVGIRAGIHIVLGVPIFDVVVQHHSCPPYENAGYYSMIAYSELTSAEDWLLNLAVETFRRAGKTTVRLATWPDPYQAALTIRHDYDRPIQSRQLSKLLRLYERKGIRSTWFWRRDHLRRDQISDVLSHGHEVALHTEGGSVDVFANQEIRAFRDEVGVSPAGFSAHGGIGAAGYLGLTQIEWAIENGMRYGEMLGRGGGRLPHQAVVLRDALPRGAEMILPPTHKGLDLTTHPDGHRYDTLLPEVAHALRNGEHCVIMNHPDIHVDLLIKLIERTDLAGVWNATLADICDWTRKTKAGAWMDGGVIRFREPPDFPVRVFVRTANAERTAIVPAGTRELTIFDTSLIHDVGARPPALPAL